MPAVLIKRTVFYWANSVLPLIACGQVCSLYDTSAGETEYTWTHIVKSLRKILTHTVLTTLPSVDREEADVLQVCSNLAVAPYTQVCFCKCAFGLDDGSVLFPFLA